MKNKYLITLLLCIYVLCAVVILIPSSTTKKQTYSIEKIAQLLSKDHIDIHSAQAEFKQSELKICLPMSLSPILNKQLKNVENFSLSVAFEDQFRDVMSLPTNVIPIANNQVAYTDLYSFEISFTVPTNARTTDISRFLENTHPSLELHFKNKNNETVASLTDIPLTIHLNT
ncbi:MULTISPECIES: hypothetical protein [Listeria]|uniref:hypothetical protein n=1 Tax=Listeria TaxID=1637 RepID=UPI000B5958FC|nr:MULTISPECIES: hypothetical protein [Listeria]